MDIKQKFSIEERLSLIPEYAAIYALERHDFYVRDVYRYARKTQPDDGYRLTFRVPLLGLDTNHGYGDTPFKQVGCMQIRKYFQDPLPHSFESFLYVIARRENR